MPSFSIQPCVKHNTDLLDAEHALDERVDNLLAGEDELRRGLSVLLGGVLLVLARPEQLQEKLGEDFKKMDSWQI